MRSNHLFLILLLLLSAANGYADDVVNTIESSAPTQNTVTPSTKAIDNSTAVNTQVWQLTNDEWQDYLKLMQGASGKWYQQLSPPEVLGINAQSQQEQQHFAEIVARQEHDKIERELSFDTAFHNAMNRLYMNEPIIRPFDLTPFSPIKNSSDKAIVLQPLDHLVLFIDVKETNDALITKLLSKIASSHSITLTIYCENAADSIIQQWAAQTKIPQDLVSSGRITLNHDDGQQLRKTAGDTVLPIVLLVRNGISRKLDVNSLS